MDEFLFKISAIFFVVTAVVGLLHRIRIPGIVGLILAGIFIGPYGLRLLEDSTQIALLAEFGIILLMFSIGLDFNRGRLVELRKAAGIGFFQIAFCVIIVFVGTYSIFDMSWQKALLFGFFVSHTSSTLLLKIYSERGELSTAPSRLGLGVSITQDLASVPMLVCLPLIAIGAVSNEVLSYPKIIQGVFTLAVMGALLRWGVPAILRLVIQSHSRELILFFLMLVCLGTSWATHSVGLSAALGAFIAGLALAGSHYSHQIHAEVSPLRDLLVSLFFISVGMLLNTTTLISQVHVYLPCLLLIIALKFLSGFIPVLLGGYPLRIATLTGAAIAQIGEFSFVLALIGLSLGLISIVDYQIFIITGVLSMLLSPYLVGAAPHLFNVLHRLPMPRSIKEGRFTEQEEVDELLQLNGHVLIAGYGLNGKNLVRALKSLDIPYAATELVPETVAKAQKAHERVYYGDCTRPDILRRMQIKNARVFVVAISDPHATRSAVQVARHESSTVHIIVRTRYVHEIERLLKIGANEVIPEEFETSLEILARTLHEYQVPRRTVDQAVLTFRSGAYRALREKSPRPANRELLGELSLTLEIESTRIKCGDAAVGKTLRDLDLPARTGVVILAIRRADDIIASLPADFIILENDMVILVGKHQQIIEALDLLEVEKIVEE